MKNIIFFISFLVIYTKNIRFETIYKYKQGENDDRSIAYKN